MNVLTGFFGVSSHSTAIGGAYLGINFGSWVLNVYSKAALAKVSINI